MAIAEQYQPPIPLLGRLKRRARPAARSAPVTPARHPAPPLVLTAEARVPPRAVPVPRSARIRLAFLEVPPTPVEALVLTALADNPGETSEALGLVCGWRGKIWHTHLAAICHKRMQWLFDDAETASEGRHFLYGVLADYDDETASFTMRTEAEIALAGLGVIAARG